MKLSLILSFACLFVTRFASAESCVAVTDPSTEIEAKLRLSFVSSIRADRDDLLARQEDSARDAVLWAKWNEYVGNYNRFVLKTLIQKDGLLLSDEDSAILDLLILPESPEFKIILSQVIEEKIQEEATSHAWSPRAQVHIRSQLNEISSGLSEANPIIRTAIRFCRALHENVQRKDLLALLANEDDSNVFTAPQDSPTRELSVAEVGGILNKTQEVVDSIHSYLNDYSRDKIVLSTTRVVMNLLRLPADSFILGSRGSNLGREFFSKVITILKINRMSMIQMVHNGAYVHAPEDASRAFGSEFKKSIDFAAKMSDLLTQLSRKTGGREGLFEIFGNSLGHEAEFFFTDKHFGAFLRASVNLKNLTDSQFSSLFFLNLIGWQDQRLTQAIVSNGAASLQDFIHGFFAATENQPFFVINFTPVNANRLTISISSFTSGLDSPSVDVQVVSASRRLERAIIRLPAPGSP